MIPYRIGTGFDVHPLIQGRPLYLGGLNIPHHLGLQGHSDADVLLHAVCDAMLGALALGDLGHHFPPGDPRWAGVRSTLLVEEVVKRVRALGWRAGNVDCTVIAERPKLAPHLPEMRAIMAGLLDLALDAVSIKATTSERLGFTGREEGIAAQAVVLLARANP